MSTSGGELQPKLNAPTPSQPPSSKPLWLTIILDNSLKFEKQEQFIPEFTHIHQSLQKALTENDAEEVQKTLHSFTEQKVALFFMGLGILTNCDDQKKIFLHKWGWWRKQIKRGSIEDHESVQPITSFYNTLKSEREKKNASKNIII